MSRGVEFFVLPPLLLKFGRSLTLNFNCVEEELQMCVCDGSQSRERKNERTLFNPERIIQY